MAQQQFGHHIVPVSIGGMNFQENILLVTQYEHDLIHQTLDVSAKVIRSFRCKTNHLMMKPDEKFVRELMHLHHMYFARVPMLPEKLVQGHAESMKAQAERYRKENNLCSVNDTKHGTWVHMFNYWLSVYHNSMLEIVNR